MNEAEALEILHEHLSQFNNYAGLVPLVDSGSEQNFEVCGVSGTKYQVEL